MRVGRHTRATLSMDEAAASERPSRKMSADAISRKSSFVHSRVVSDRLSGPVRPRNHAKVVPFQLQKARADYRVHSDEVDSRGSDSSLK